MLVPDLPLGSHQVALGGQADLSLRGLGDIVLDLLGVGGIEQPLLVGSDTGGAIVQSFAARNPAALAGMVLTNCDAFEYFPPAPFDRQLGLFSRPSLARLVMQLMRSRRLRSGGFGWGGLTTSHLDSRLTWQWCEPYLSDEGVRRDLSSYARSWDREELVALTGELAAVRLPVRIVWGAADRYFPLSLGRRLTDLLDGSVFEPVPGAGTLVALDRPEKVVDAIRQALAI